LRASGVDLISCFKYLLSVSPYQNVTYTTLNVVVQNEDGEAEEEEEEETDDGALEYIPWLSYAFPFAPNVNHISQELRNEINGSMPDANEAEELAAFYFQYAAWM
jgi:hypothetical protein